MGLELAHAAEDGGDVEDGGIAARPRRAESAGLSGLLVGQVDRRP
jgi:hypothetical protein